MNTFSYTGTIQYEVFLNLDFNCLELIIKLMIMSQLSLNDSESALYISELVVITLQPIKGLGNFFASCSSPEHSSRNILRVGNNRNKYCTVQ